MNNNKVGIFSILLIDNNNRFEVDESKCSVIIRLDPLPLHQLNRQPQFLLCPGIILSICQSIYVSIYQLCINLLIYLFLYQGICQSIPLVDLQIDYLRSIYSPQTIVDNNNDNNTIVNNNISNYESIDISLTCSLTSLMVINSLYKNNFNRNKLLDRDKKGKFLLVKLLKEVFWRRIMECKEIYLCIKLTLILN